MLAGFENHGGRTRLGPDAVALGRVISGHGNNGADGLEGVRRLNLIGTYLHGPLLPKNAWLADHLIAARARPPHGLGRRARAARRRPRAGRARERAGGGDRTPVALAFAPLDATLGPTL